MAVKQTTKKKVLGRGLGALIGVPKAKVAESVSASTPTEAVTADNEKAEGSYFLCPVARISPGRQQPRKNFNEKKLQELSASIRSKGIIEPLVVKRGEGNGFELIAGERRLRASKLAGLAQVPIVIIDATNEEALELAIIENVQRDDLNAIEEAEAYSALVHFGLSQDEVATKVGKERATVTNYLRLLKLPPEVKAEVAVGNIRMGHARAILSLEGLSAQRALCKKVVKKGLSVRQTEAIASKALIGSPAAKAKAPNLMAPVEETLRRRLGTKISIKEKNKKGKIEIYYYSVDERERLLTMLNKLA